MTKKSRNLIEKKITITVNGKSIRKSFYGHSESEILKKIAAYNGEVKSGRSFKALSEAWQQEHFEEITQGTITSYKPAIVRANREFANMKINAITPLDIIRILNKMKKENYSQQTARIFLSVVNQICSYAVINGDLTVNPATEVKLPKGMPKSQREMPDDSILDIVKSSFEDPFGLFAYFLLYTGCRRGEALALQWKDINFINKTIYISKSVYYVSNSPKIKMPKTSAGNRQIILLDRLADKLLPIQGNPDDFVFGDDKPLTQQMFRRRWDAYCKRCGLTGDHKLTAHQLRHAYATILYEAGIPDKDAQNLLGHSKISVTRDIYTHIRQSRMADTAEKLNSIV